MHIPAQISGMTTPIIVLQKSVGLLVISQCRAEEVVTNAPWQLAWLNSRHGSIRDGLVPTLERLHGRGWRVLECSTAGEYSHIPLPVSRARILICRCWHWSTSRPYGANHRKIEWPLPAIACMFSCRRSLVLPSPPIVSMFHHRWSLTCSAAGDRLHILPPAIACMFCCRWSLACSAAGDRLHVLPPAAGAWIIIFKTSRS